MMANKCMVTDGLYKICLLYVGQEGRKAQSLARFRYPHAVLCDKGEGIKETQHSPSSGVSKRLASHGQEVILLYNPSTRYWYWLVG